MAWLKLGSGFKEYWFGMPAILLAACGLWLKAPPSFWTATGIAVVPSYLGLGL